MSCFFLTPLELSHVIPQDTVKLSCKHLVKALPRGEKCALALSQASPTTGTPVPPSNDSTTSMFAPYTPESMAIQAVTAAAAGTAAAMATEAAAKAAFDKARADKRIRITNDVAQALEVRAVAAEDMAGAAIEKEAEVRFELEETQATLQETKAALQAERSAALEDKAKHAVLEKEAACAREKTDSLEARDRLSTEKEMKHRAALDESSAQAAALQTKVDSIASQLGDVQTESADKAAKYEAALQQVHSMRAEIKVMGNVIKQGVNQVRQLKDSAKGKDVRETGRMRAGPDRYCPPRHPTHFEPSSLKLSVGSGIESKLFDQSERSNQPQKSVLYPVHYRSSQPLSQSRRELEGSPGDADAEFK